MTMLKQIDTKMQLPKEINSIFCELQVLKFLRKAGITKASGYSSPTLFIFLFATIFKGRTPHQLISGRQSEELMKKDALYRFMNAPKYNWRKFLLSLSAFVISKLQCLTNSNTHIRALIIDDSSFYRNRSKKISQLAWLFDHALHQSYKGFRLLTLGFSDGHSFIPIDFALLSGKKQVTDTACSLDQRTSAGKRSNESSQKAPDVVVEMVKRALDHGIYATHVLMDKWFTYPKLINQLQELGIHVIGMVKNSSTRYLYESKQLTLAQLFKKSRRDMRATEIISSIHIRLQSGLPVKVVFVQNRNKKSEWLAIMTTDVDLTSQEIVKTYGVRWDIETFFKVAKSLLKLSKETQTRHYQGLICHTTIVFVRYIILSWQQRCASDDRTLGGMFYDLCDELQELDWAVALIELTELLLDVADKSSKRLDALIQCQLQQWFDRLPSYIKAYLPNLVCET